VDGSARETWNARYRERGSDPGPPSDWLVENQALISGTRALDLACGTGRNARHLAGLGFTVDALDISDVAIEALQGIAGVHARAVDLEREALPAGAYDVVLMINYLQRDLFAAAADALAAGGVLIAETVTRAHVEQLRRAFDPRFLLEPGELRDAFPDLHVLRFEEGVVQRSGRPRAVAALVAQRPAELAELAELTAQRPG
jgi:tellurite methyltransferase